MRGLKDSALIQITSVPDEVNYRGEQMTPRSFPKECLPCYEMDPTDPESCIHQELFYGDPHGSGHSYKRSSFEMYSEAQRLEWRSRSEFEVLNLIMMQSSNQNEHNYTQDTFLTVFYSRYYKSCLEPLNARYVTNEMTTGGCYRDIVYL
jgi:hypothetical protein